MSFCGVGAPSVSLTLIYRTLRASITMYIIRDSKSGIGTVNGPRTVTLLHKQDFRRFPKRLLAPQTSKQEREISAREISYFFLIPHHRSCNDYSDTPTDRSTTTLSSTVKQQARPCTSQFKQASNQITSNLREKE